MAVDTKKYLEELLTEAGVSDDNVKQAVSNFFSNEKVSKRLGDDLLRQQDYSRNMDAVAAEKKKTADYYQNLTTWQATEQQKINDFWQQYQGNNGNAGGEVVNGQYVSKKDLEALEQKYAQQAKQQESSFITIAKMMGRLSSQHAVEFHEPLDVDALEKIAVEKQLPLPQAYEAMMAPRRTELQNKSFEAKLAAAKEEGAREYASKHKIPLDSAPREHHVMFDRDLSKQVSNDYVPNSGNKTPVMERTLRENFAEAWDNYQKPASGTSGT